MILIRPVKTKDLPEIVKMRMELLKFHGDLDDYLAGTKNAEIVFQKLYKTSIHSRNKKLLVAEKDKRLIAFGFANIIKSEISKVKVHGHIHDVFVKKEYRHQGIAGMILQSFYEWFRKKGVRYVEITVHSKNKIGYNAWTKYGYKDFLIRKRIALK